MKNQIVHKDISFFEKVYQVVRLIPKGKVTSYGAIAKYLGTARSARMVGWAMNAAVDPFLIVICGIAGLITSIIIFFQER